MNKLCVQTVTLRCLTMLLPFAMLNCLSTKSYASNFGVIAQCKHWVSDAAMTQCLEDAQNYAKQNSKSQADLEKAASYIQEFDQAGAAKVYLMQIQLLGAKPGCTKPGVRGSAMQALRSSDATVGEAGVAIAKSCFGELSSEMIEATSEKLERYLARVCPLLLKNKAISGLKAKRCESFK